MNSIPNYPIVDLTFMRNHMSISASFMNVIENFVPLNANPNRNIQTDGDNVIVRTHCGSVYIFDSITQTPIFIDGMDIYRAINDLRGNTLYIRERNGNNAIYRLDLQGHIIWSVFSDSSNNSIIIPSINTSYTSSTINTSYTSSTTNTDITTNTPSIRTATYTSNISNVNLFSGSIIKKKIMEHQDSICPIKQEQIEQYDIYMNCNCCNKNFFEDEIRRWLLTTQFGNKTCPNCRSQWINNNMYVNRE
jgi:hypothetical protein